MTMQDEILRQVLAAKGLNPDEVLQEVQTEQKVVSVLRQIGKSIAEILGGNGYATIEVIVNDGKVQVMVTGGLRTRHVEFSLDLDREARSKGIGSHIVELLEEAGLILKDWQRRSIMSHFPQIVKSFLKQYPSLAEHPKIQEAIEIWKLAHPERAQWVKL